MKLFFPIAATLLSLGLAPAHSIELIGDLGGPRGFGENFLDRNDDGSTGQLNLPFDINFFGTNYSTFYINNNGNITFNSPLSNFTPSAFPGSPLPIIAPWWADADTRSAESGLVWYTSPNENSLVITWDNVGYYRSAADLTNSFQLILQRSIDSSPGDFLAEFRYQQLQWTTGDASDGEGGLGGTPAQAGFDSGAQGNGSYLSLPGSLTSNVLDLVNLSNVSPETPGLWRFQFGSEIGAPGETPENPLLPIVVEDGFEFSFPVTDPSVTVFIDPPVAVGYNYVVSDLGGPLFDSVTAPSLPGDTAFDLFTSGDACSTYGVSQGVINAGVPFSFTTPVPCFSIQGIDVAEMLDPSDPLAFITGVSFDSPGSVTMTQTPITVDVPDSAVPGPLPVLGMGAAFGWSRRLRRRQAQLRGGRQR
jgi:hypothetical protein